jgi:hypothetical protein
LRERTIAAYQDPRSAILSIASPNLPLPAADYRQRSAAWTTTRFQFFLLKRKKVEFYDGGFPSAVEGEKLQGFDPPSPGSSPQGR